MEESRKIAVLTGATGGIGSVVCKYLADCCYTVYAACRNNKKAQSLLDTIPEDKRGYIEFIELDLTSLQSADEFCDTIICKLNGNKIDLLINNAGMIAKKFNITSDGYETSMQVNYISVKKITERLIPHISGKIINTVSCTIHSASLKRALKSATGGFETDGSGRKQSTLRSLSYYSDSKLMLALYTLDLSKRVSDTGLTVCGADPGIVDTGIITMHRWYDPIANLLFRPFIKSAEQGAIPIINAIGHKVEGTREEGSALLFAGNSCKSFPRRIRNRYDRGLKLITPLP